MFCNVGGFCVLSFFGSEDSESGLWLRKYVFKSPFSISSMTTRVGWPRDTTPSNRTTWCVSNAFITEASFRNSIRSLKNYGNLYFAKYLSTFVLLVLRKTVHIAAFQEEWPNPKYFLVLLISEIDQENVFFFREWNTDLFIG